MWDDIFKFCGLAFIFCAFIGLACLVKYLWGEVSRWCGMSWRGLFIGGWKPGGITWDSFKTDWWWHDD